MVHALFNGKSFLSADAFSVIKECIREILFRNKSLNPNYWCMCLPYVLKKGGYKDSLRLDYIILVPVSSKFFIEWYRFDSRK